MSRAGKSGKKKPTGEQLLKQAFEAVDKAPLLAKLGVEVSAQGLCTALTHRSFANENGFLPNNERLEFLGDAVLGLSVAHSLFERYPSSPESDISKMRAAVVSRYGLADIARDIDLGPHILLGKGELATGGSAKESILADTTEAIFGAIYLEHGFDKTKEVILALFDNKLRNVQATGRHVDYKTVLQERCAELCAPAPKYSSVSEGPEHEQVFTSTVTVNEVELGTGEGRNKKKSEQVAASAALETLRTRPDLIAGTTSKAVNEKAVRKEEKRRQKAMQQAQQEIAQNS